MISSNYHHTVWYPKKKKNRDGKKISAKINICHRYKVGIPKGEKKEGEEEKDGEKKMQTFFMQREKLKLASLTGKEVQTFFMQREKLKLASLTGKEGNREYNCPVSIIHGKILSIHGLKISTRRLVL